MARYLNLQTGISNEKTPCPNCGKHVAFGRDTHYVTGIIPGTVAGFACRKVE